jgi:hypothetical protein
VHMPLLGEMMNLLASIALVVAVLFWFLLWLLPSSRPGQGSRPRRVRGQLRETLPYSEQDSLGSARLPPGEFLPYRKRDYLLTRAERSFFEVLIRALPPDLHVFAKVRLADLVWIPRRHPRRRVHLYRVLPKHIDFVVCDSARISPLVAIELDDSSHQRPDRVERDTFVNEALRTAGLPLVRVPVKNSYSLKEMQKLVSEALRRPEATSADNQSRTPTPPSAAAPPSILVEDVNRHIDPIGGTQDRPPAASPSSTAEGDVATGRRP